MAEPLKVVLRKLFAKSYKYDYYDPDYDLVEEEWDKERANGLAKFIPPPAARYYWYIPALAFAWIFLVGAHCFLRRV